MLEEVWRGQGIVSSNCGKAISIEAANWVKETDLDQLLTSPVFRVVLLADILVLDVEIGLDTFFTESPNNRA
jgi:hypothetical protein